MRSLFNLLISGGGLFVTVWNFSKVEYFFWAYLALVAISFATNFFLNDKNFLTSFFLLGFFGTILAVSSIFVKITLTLAAIFVFFLFATGRANKFKIGEQFFVLVTGLFLNIAFWSVNFFFIPPWWMLTFLSAVIFGGIFWQIFKNIAWSGISTLIMIEIIASALYLPFHFLTLSVLTFVGFYLIYMIGSLFLRGRLSERVIYFHLSLAAIVLFFSLITSPWIPIV